MLTQQDNARRPSFDCLDFGRLRRLLADLALQVGYLLPGRDEISGFDLDALPCRHASATGRHCQPFLLQLARDAQADPAVQCRACLSGAFTLAVRLDDAGDSPVILACGLTQALPASQEARNRLRALQLDGIDLLSPSAESAPYRPDDPVWLAAAFARIARDWYAHAGEHAREVEILSQSLADTYEELSANYRLSQSMNLTATPGEYLQELAEELRDLLVADAVVISLLPQPASPSGAADAVTIVVGRPPVPADRILSSVDMDKLAKRGYQVLSVAADGLPVATGQAAAQVLLTPIARNERRLGFVAAWRAGAARQVSNIDVTRISSIARSAAVVLENFRLYDNQRQLFLGTVRALTRSIDAKDPYTCGHSERVAVLSRRIVLQLGGTGPQAERVYLCGLLHDIGKIGVPEFVLRKPGRLTEEEFAKIKRHPVVGATILDGIHELGDVVPGVVHHHERYDGRGYPHGLKGPEIPFYARVLTVADTFDAMTSARPYRKALSVQVAVDELHRHAGAQFDPAIVEAFLQLGPQAVFDELSQIHSGYRPSSTEPALASGGDVR